MMESTTHILCSPRHHLFGNGVSRQERTEPHQVNARGMNCRQLSQGEGPGGGDRSVPGAEPSTIGKHGFALLSIERKVACQAFSCLFQVGSCLIEGQGKMP